MHRDEAAYVFCLLGDPDRIKMVKMSYNNDGLNLLQLMVMIGNEEEKFNKDLAMLVDGNILFEKDQMYYANKEYIDEALTFIQRPCGCCHHQ